MSGRRSRRALVSALVVGALSVALIAVLATRTTAPGTQATSSLGGKRAPALSGETIIGQRRVDLASLRGRYVLVDFFASWCGPCIAEIPELARFVFEHRNDARVSVLGVDIDDSLANGRAFLTKVGATWPAIEDGDGHLAERYGVVDPPESFLVDPAGRVVATFGSGVTANQLDAVIATARALR
jgi:thiol-disulfide isomerase/thioredoxin